MYPPNLLRPVMSNPRKFSASPPSISTKPSVPLSKIDTTLHSNLPSNSETRNNQVAIPSIPKQSSHPDSPARRVCLCSPTSHAGSFRCRLHRATQKEWPHPVIPRHSTSSALHDDESSVLRILGQEQQAVVRRTASFPSRVGAQKDQKGTRRRMSRLRRVASADMLSTKC
eukprot:c12263_g1_i1 orf=91-600(-)